MSDSESRYSEQRGALDARKIWLPVGTVIGVVALILGAKAWLDETLSTSEKRNMDRVTQADKESAARFALLTSQIESLKDDVKDLRYEFRNIVAASRVEDRFTGSDIKIMLARMESMNPGFKIPPITDLLNDNR